MPVAATPGPAGRTQPQRAGRRSGMLVAAVVVLIGFVGAAIGLWVAADKRYDDNVVAFARAPVGCQTTLQFDRSGEFVLYLETTGEVEGISGDCDVTEEYDRDATGLPRPELLLRDPDGDELELASTGGVDYDAAGFVGTAYRLVDIVDEGAHVLTVGSVDGEAFAMAIGGDPRDGVALLRWGALVSLIVGLIAGGLLLVLGSRRPVVDAPGADPWAPDGSAWPSSPPGFPAPPPTTGAAGPAGPPLAAPPTNVPPTDRPSGTPTPPGGSPWAPPTVG
ncbi:MAG: hypothetical protein WBP59_13665 [Ilumatobacteraceae bacterium]